MEGSVRPGNGSDYTLTHAAKVSRPIILIYLLLRQLKKLIIQNVIIRGLDRAGNRFPQPWVPSSLAIILASPSHRSLGGKVLYIVEVLNEHLPDEISETLQWILILSYVAEFLLV